MRLSPPIKISRPLALSGLLLLSLTLFPGCSSVLNQKTIAEVDVGSTGVRGVVRKQDHSPAGGAFVYAYRSASQGLRGPADFGARVDRSGHYFLDLVEGEYLLVARLRESGADAGPPRPGDAWAIYPENPVKIEPEQVREIDFTLQGGAVPRQVRQGSLTTGDTGFTGRLVDAEDKPFSGAFALAYRSADFQRMPDYTSAPADANGRFTLYVPDPGEYCLAARTKTRGQPRAGEMYGTLGFGAEACRSVVTGEVIDIGRMILTPHR